MLGNNYFCIANKPFFDNTLSLNGKGLYGMIIYSVSEIRVKSLKQLEENIGLGKNEVDTAWKELESKGYLDEVYQYFDTKLDRDKYYIFPELLLSDEKYKWISADAKLFYGCILDYLNQNDNEEEMFDIRKIDYPANKKHLKMLLDCGLVSKVPGKRFTYIAKKIMEE